jgi:membrane-associated phospholipid phosphatase
LIQTKAKLDLGSKKLKIGKVKAFSLAIALLVLAGQFGTTSAIAGTAGISNPVVVWDQLTTKLGLAHQVPAPFLAHDYALVHVAMYDALLSNSEGSLPQTAIVAGAAKEVLLYLFTSDAAEISSTFNSQLTNITGYSKDQIHGAISIGINVGEAVIAYAQTDGSIAAWNGVRPTGPCIWNGSNPVGPVFGYQKTFILTSPREFQPPPPYACGSPQDLQDVQAVIDAHESLTPEEIAIVHKWADLPPPTLWNNMLNERISNHSLNTFDAARASAYLNVGMYDAFVTCWMIKYTYWTARPFQRIPGFVPEITTPNFPSYASGHSIVSSTASIIMGRLFRAEATFFVGQAQEAAISRLWGGIHFPQDNNNGFALGQLIGAEVVQDMQGSAHLFVLHTNTSTASKQTSSTGPSISLNLITSALQVPNALITIANTVLILWLVITVRRLEKAKHGRSRSWYSKLESKDR